jgi:hypothetical protein
MLRFLTRLVQSEREQVTSRPVFWWCVTLSFLTVAGLSPLLFPELYMWASVTAVAGLSAVLRLAVLLWGWLSNRS